MITTMEGVAGQNKFMEQEKKRGRYAHKDGGRQRAEDRLVERLERVARQRARVSATTGAGRDREEEEEEEERGE